MAPISSNLPVPWTPGLPGADRSAERPAGRPSDALPIPAGAHGVAPGQPALVDTDIAAGRGRLPADAAAAPDGGRYDRVRRPDTREPGADAESGRRSSGRRSAFPGGGSAFAAQSLGQDGADSRAPVPAPWRQALASYRRAAAGPPDRDRLVDLVIG